MNPSPASTVLILGARGRLGLAATRAFAEAGWQVYAQMRPGATGPAMAGVQWISALAEDTPALAARSQGAQVVDVGSGAGLPGVVWALALPGRRVRRWWCTP